MDEVNFIKFLINLDIPGLTDLTPVDDDELVYIEGESQELLLQYISKILEEHNNNIAQNNNKIKQFYVKFNSLDNFLYSSRKRTIFLKKNERLRPSQNPKNQRVKKFVLRQGHFYQRHQQETVDKNKKRQENEKNVILLNFIKEITESKKNNKLANTDKNILTNDLSEKLANFLFSDKKINVEELDKSLVAYIKNINPLKEEDLRYATTLFMAKELSKYFVDSNSIIEKLNLLKSFIDTAGDDESLFSYLIKIEKSKNKKFTDDELKGIFLLATYLMGLRFLRFTGVTPNKLAEADRETILTLLKFLKGNGLLGIIFYKNNNFGTAERKFEFIDRTMILHNEAFSLNDTSIQRGAEKMLYFQSVFLDLLKHLHVIDNQQIKTEALSSQGSHIGAGLQLQRGYISNNIFAYLYKKLNRTYSGKTDDRTYKDLLENSDELFDLLNKLSTYKSFTQIPKDLLKQFYNFKIKLNKLGVNMLLNQLNFSINSAYNERLKNTYYDLKNKVMASELRINDFLKIIPFNYSGEINSIEEFLEYYRLANS